MDLEQVFKRVDVYYEELIMQQKGMLLQVVFKVHFDLTFKFPLSLPPLSEAVGTPRIQGFGHGTLVLWKN